MGGWREDSQGRGDKFPKAKDPLPPCPLPPLAMSPLTRSPGIGCPRRSGPVPGASSSSSSSSLIAGRGQAEPPRDCPLHGHRPPARPCPPCTAGRKGGAAGTPGRGGDGARPQLPARLLWVPSPMSISPPTPDLLTSLHTAPRGCPPRGTSPEPPAPRRGTREGAGGSLL